MRIMNGFYNPNNTDDFTCHAPLGKSMVDYLLTTERLTELLNEFKICAKLVGSDHTPLTFSIATDSMLGSINNNSKQSKNSNHNKRYRYAFDKFRVTDYKDALNSEYAQEKLFHLTNQLSENTSSDAVIHATYEYIKTGIDPIFKKKYFKSVTNKFPTNSWYDEECKKARKTANEYAVKHDINITTCNQHYKLLHKNYKRIIQRKKRLHLQSNRDKLHQLHSTNQTECWKLWNKLTNSNNDKTTQNLPDIDTFYSYFKNQINPPVCTYFDQEHMAEIDEYIHKIKTIPDNNIIDTLPANICDSYITESEVALHLKKLKNNKAAGIDGITGEFYKCVENELIVPFCAIFNFIFDKGDYPSQWAEGLINALHKKGDHSNPDNYRKITITVAMAKIFDSILNARLYFKNDAMSLDDPFQFGFTPSRGTTDCVFVLDTIIRHEQFKKMPVYLCFVDFTKAFDYINRNALYYKLHKQKMSQKMLKIIMSMFDKTQAKVHQLGEISPPIESIFGVLQGGILSPKLFNEFMSDLPNHLSINNGIEIDGTHFTHLLYADDIVLISNSAAGLQNSIDSLHKFCAKWHLIVNILKTKVMKIGTKSSINFIYNTQSIENVDTYKYLGHIITNNQKRIHHKVTSHLITQAQKALFALRSKLKPALGHIPPLLAIKMFDSYILPILEYNSVLWSQNSPISEIEKVQLGYLKNVLNVRKQTPSLAVYAETGRFTLHIRQKLATVNYWARLQTMPNSEILNKCLKIQEKLHTNGQRNWYTKVKHIISEANIINWQALEPSVLTNKIKLVLYDNEKDRILHEINDTNAQPKLRTYKTFKTSYCIEPYLLLNLPKKTYSNIARFRVSSHNLKIETGRHESPKIPLHERICEYCDSGEIEDESHCLLTCNKNEIPRLELLNIATDSIPNFHDLDKSQQFQALLSCKNPEVLKALGNFLNRVFS